MVDWAAGTGEYASLQPLLGAFYLYVERQTLTMRMQMRRFTRLTNAFSKSLRNLKDALALHFDHYNFVRIHGSPRVTPAMAAGVADRVWELAQLVSEC